MSKTFRIRDCSIVTIALGQRALTLRELRDRLREVPGESLSHHFYEALLRPAFDDPDYRNDFATWSRRHLQDAVLAERFGIVDPLAFADLEALRAHLVDIVEERLEEEPFLMARGSGGEFEFQRSQMVVLDTGITVADPAAMAERVPHLPLGSVFYHFVEARRRTRNGADDFTVWLRAFDGDGVAIRARLAAIDFHLWSLSEMREQIAAAFGVASAQEGVP